jgi:hypothetical protein
MYSEILTTFLNKILLIIANITKDLNQTLFNTLITNVTYHKSS